MSDKPQTPFLETEVLLAWLNEDYAEVNRLISEFSNVELTTYLTQLRALSDHVKVALLYDNQRKPSI